MATRIRLQRHGKKRYPYYHIVVTDSRVKRDGAKIERIGDYNPNDNPATINIDFDRALHWLQTGAQPSDTCRAILSYKGVLHKNHLLNGVKKGAFDEAEAINRFDAWLAEKEAKIMSTEDSIAVKAAAEEKAIFEAEKEISDKRAAVILAKNSPMAEEAPAEAATAAEGDAPAAEAAPEAVAEEAPAVEAKPEPVAEEAPAAEAKAEPVAEKAPAAEAKPEPAKKEEPAKEVATVDEAIHAKEAPEESPLPVTETPQQISKPDELTKIEGIGPKIAELLISKNIATYGALAAAEVDAIKTILTEAEGNFASHEPTTWPMQAKLAADGKWDELKKWQDESDGGKPVEAKSGEKE